MSLIHVSDTYLDFTNRYFSSGRSSIPTVLMNYVSYDLRSYLEWTDPEYCVVTCRKLHLRDRLNMFNVSATPLKKPNDRARSQSWTDPRVQTAMRERGKR